MTYAISCPCGKTLPVSATQAGGRILCSCGQSVDVPVLSRLRQAVGQEAYATSTVDVIQRMIRDGELPYGDTCALSGLPTLDVYTLSVQCESKWVRGPGTGRYLFVALSILFLPFWMLWVLLGKALLDEERQELGRDRVVSAPLRVREEHHDRLRRTRSQSKLRKLLRAVPIYAKLLEEFPRARITT